MTVEQDWRRTVEHVRGAFPPAVLRAVREHLEQVSAARQARAATDREHRAIARGESSDALRLDPRWYEPWAAPSGALRAAIGPYVWVVYPPQVRWVRALAHRVPWHQDAGYQRLLGGRGHREHITCFVPLDDDPLRRTTLQFARASAAELPHVARDGFGAGLAEQPAGDLVHFSLAPGDALVFGDLVVHRTFVPDGALVERRSLEFRLVRPADALVEKDYLDLRAERFVRPQATRRAVP